LSATKAFLFLMSIGLASQDLAAQSRKGIAVGRRAKTVQKKAQAVVESRAQEERALPPIEMSTKAPKLAAQAKAIIDSGDYLGFRVFLRKNFSRIRHPQDWMNIRALIIDHADQVGFDIVYAWDKRPPGRFVDSGTMNINVSRFEADNLMLQGRFQEAFDLYQKIAVELRRVRRTTRSAAQLASIDFLNPYILHGMGRALYGAGRFDEAYVVLRWVPQSYSKFRQIQFEKMWAAFRGGRIDHALGAIASQQSDYFSRYLSPESYLVEVYLYKKLCREDDFKQVLKSVYDFKAAMSGNQYTLEEWSKSDVETRTLWNLVRANPEQGSPLVPITARRAEQARIKKILELTYQSQKTRVLDDIERVLAYVQLTVNSGSSKSVLKPIERLPDRQSLFKLGLEIWPADTSEEWVDEVGTHRFVGDSLCGKSKG
jgi:hypothetical protein